MRNLKKFLALVMAMVMALSLMVSANAATANVTYGDSDSVTPVFAEAVDVLSGMGVFNGDNGNFRPASTITRGEVAAIVYRLVTGDVNDTRSGLYKTYAPFVDVSEKDWFAGYVGYLWNAGFIKGTTATTYNPYAPVTGYEALAMILRGVGYDKNHEFEGAQWIVNVASYATTLGILRDVKTTHFADTLHLGARRDVVASLLFNTAAYVPEVTYNTLAGGYNQYKHVATTEWNQTLGQRLFGLTYDHGIVVGNQATGEKYTKIGFSTSNLAYEMPGLQGKFTISRFPAKPDYNAYIYAAGNVDDPDPWTDADGNRIYTNNQTNSFIWDTDLKLFGHQVKVWYDGRNTINSNNERILTTYAMYDEAAKTEVVKAVAGSDINADSLTTDKMLGKVADGKGFKVNTTGGAYYNYSFGPTFGSHKNVTSAGSNHTNFESPIKALNDSFTADDDAAPYYLLISNSTDKENSLDMIISLDLTVTQISQQNDVWDPLTIGLNVGNDATGATYFGGTDSDNEQLDIGGATPWGKRVNIAQKNLVLNSDKTLGDNVAAIEIVGTTGTNIGANNTATLGNAKAVIKDTGNTSKSYYQTVKLTRQVTGSVVKVDTDTHEVWFSDGTKLERSWLADTVANNRLLNLGSDDVTNTEANVRRAMEPDAFATYTFTLDEDGKYIFWSTEKTGDRFVYGTYLDYNTQTASSTFIYPLVGVGLDGKRSQDNITKVTDDNNYTSEVFAGAKLNTDTYEDISLPKRDAKSAEMGAQVYKGRYIGYTINDKGEITTVDHDKNAVNTVKQGDTNFFGFAPNGTDLGSIDINSDDVKIGAVFAGINAAGNTSLYLTENTQFYLVSGAGTDNQKVASYKGLAALMSGMDRVIIHGEKNVEDTRDAKGADNDTKWPLKDDINNYEMIYWTQSSFHYAQDYATTAYQADVVILPLEAVEFRASVDSALHFVGNTASTLIDSDRDATQFTMYDVNGTEKNVWVKGLQDNGGTNANPADTIIDMALVNPAKTEAGNDHFNFFLNLIPTDEKAKDGNPIYKIAAVSGASTKLIGRYLSQYNEANKTAAYDYVNDDPTTNGDFTYIATTYSSQLATIGGDRSAIWNVADAKVVNLDTKCWPGVKDLTTLNGASSLEQNNATGVGALSYSNRLQVSCFLSKDNSKKASVIFVDYENKAQHDKNQRT